MGFKEISEYRNRLRLSFVRLGDSPSTFIFRLGEIRYTLCGIPTGRYLVKISEGLNVFVGTDVL